MVEAVRGTAPPILVIEAPVRHGKSRFISQYVCSWYLCTFPRRNVVLTSATGTLATRWSRKAQEAFSYMAPRYFDTGLSRKRRASNDWETTDGGGMRAAGIGGDIMGRDMHLGVVDDYLKNSADALSETMRDSQWEWLQSTMLTRMEGGAAVIFMCTRWHRDDLIGRLVGESDTVDASELMPLHRIRLPAVAEDNDYLGREPGEALWPERWPLGEPDRMVANKWGRNVPGLRMRQRTIAAHWWSSLYQQAPIQHGETEWPEHYFDRIWTTAWPHAWDMSAIGVDCAQGKKDGDYTAIVFMGLSGGRLWVDAVVRRIPVEHAVAETFAMVFEQKVVDGVGVESNLFQSLIGEVFTLYARDHQVLPLPYIPLDNRVNKEIRIKRLGPYLAAKKLLFRDTVGNRRLVAQLREFPLGDYDDGPDAMEMALRVLQMTRWGRHATDYDTPETLIT